MVSTTPLVLLAAGFVVTGVLELLVLQVAQRRALYAQPNERSSHTVPTPSLGGIGIMLPILGLMAWLWLIEGAPIGGLLFGTAVLTAIGLWDD